MIKPILDVEESEADNTLNKSCLHLQTRPLVNFSEIMLSFFPFFLFNTLLSHWAKNILYVFSNTYTTGSHTKYLFCFFGFLSKVQKDKDL